jgi:hypothetical protein
VERSQSEGTENIAVGADSIVSDIPAPPWHLRGTAVVLPHGVLGVLALVHYEASPVGSYDELAVITLTRRGPSVVAMYVNSAASAHGGQRGWGYPKQLRSLRWRRRGQRVLFRAGQRQWLVRPWGPAFPARINAWTAQTLNGCLVRAPVRVVGRVQMAWNGRRLALVVELAEMTVLPPQKIA